MSLQEHNTYDFKNGNKHNVIYFTFYQLKKLHLLSFGYCIWPYCNFNDIVINRPSNPAFFRIKRSQLCFSLCCRKHQSECEQEVKRQEKEMLLKIEMCECGCRLRWEIISDKGFQTSWPADVGVQCYSVTTVRLHRVRADGKLRYLKTQLLINCVIGTKAGEETVNFFFFFTKPRENL